MRNSSQIQPCTDLNFCTPTPLHPQTRQRHSDSISSLFPYPNRNRASQGTNNINAGIRDLAPATCISRTRRGLGSQWVIPSKLAINIKTHKYNNIQSTQDLRENDSTIHAFSIPIPANLFSIRTSPQKKSPPVSYHKYKHEVLYAPT